jgi:hypothetical protein
MNVQHHIKPYTVAIQLNWWELLCLIFGSELRISGVSIAVSKLPEPVKCPN